MRTALFAATLSLCLAAPAFAAPAFARPRGAHAAASPAASSADAAAMPRLPSQPAFEATVEDGAACGQGARLLSHAAYVPGADKARSVPCGQPLSTDTLMSIHHWDQT